MRQVYRQLKASNLLDATTILIIKILVRFHAANKSLSMSFVLVFQLNTNTLWVWPRLAA